MPEILVETYMTVVAVINRVLDFLTGEVLEVREARERVPDIRRILAANASVRRLPHSGSDCNW